jgi:protein gp37
MAENSLIAWTDDTLNIWIGCNPVRFAVSLEQAKLLELSGQIIVRRQVAGRTLYFLASECDNCYADQWSKRRFEKAHGLPRLWGNPKETPRYEVKDWRSKLRRFNRLAEQNGRRLCFAESLSDIGEEHELVTPWRQEFMPMAAAATYVDWLMLTKRPQNMLRDVPPEWLRNWPQNVWLGYSAGTNKSIEVRARYATEWRNLGVPVVFVSVEPHLEDVDIRPAIAAGANWIITGGESGNGEERERIDADPDWFRRVRDDALSYEGVAYFHKQGSASRPGQHPELDGRLWHQWPDTRLGKLSGVRIAPFSELVPLRQTVAA